MSSFIIRFDRITDQKLIVSQFDNKEDFEATFDEATDQWNNSGDEFRHRFVYYRGF